MIAVVLIGIALPVCLVLVVLTCLNCFQRSKFQTFNNNRLPEAAQHNPSFTIDIADPQTDEQVAIEPLPDILVKTSNAAPLRPRMTFLEGAKQGPTLSLVNIQRSFPRDQIQYLNEIGSGWFGKVLESEAAKIVSGTVKSRVMVKMLKDDASKFEQKQFLDEVYAFRCLDHANLLGLLGQCVETTPFLVLLEFAPHGNLKTYLVQHRMEVEVMIKKHRLLGFAVDAATGLACLHRHGYIHNDLAARNCLVMSDYSLKIGDYGISEVVFKEDYMASGSDLLPIRWMAPESLIQSQGVWTVQPGDKVSDMWSFGILLWEIFSYGERPYDMLTEEAVLQGVVVDKLIRPSELDTKLTDRDKLWQLMNQCWQDPAQRVDIERIYQQLDHLTSARRDTLEVSIDFEQRWRELQPKKHTSSTDTDLGSRLALAGSFAGSNTTESSSPSLGTDILSDFTTSLDSKAGYAAESLPDPTAKAGSGDGDNAKDLLGGNSGSSPAIPHRQSEEFVSGDTKKADSMDQAKFAVTPSEPTDVPRSAPSTSKDPEASKLDFLLSSTADSFYMTASEASSTLDDVMKDRGFLTSGSVNQSLLESQEETMIQPDIATAQSHQLQFEAPRDFDQVPSNVLDPDFTEFESAQSDSGAETKVKSNNTLDPNKYTSESKVEPESANEETSVSEKNETAGDRHQVANLAGSLSSSQFESLNLESFAGKSLEGAIFPDVPEIDPQGTGLDLSTASKNAKSPSNERVESHNAGPLLDEDVDQLVESSFGVGPAAAENGSLPSLLSEPAPLLPDKQEAVPMAPAMAHSDIISEQQSLTQNLESLPVVDVQERSEELLIAALGEPLDSQFASSELSVAKPEDSQGPGENLLGDVPENLLGDVPATDQSKKVGLAKVFESHPAVSSLWNTKRKLREESQSGLENNHGNQPPPPATQEGVSESKYMFPIHQTLSSPHQDSDKKNRAARDKMEVESESILYHDTIPHVSDHHQPHALKSENGLLKGSHLLSHPGSVNTVLHTLNQHQPSHSTKVTEPELLSPDDDITGDSGVLSGRQEHYSDSADEDEEGDDETGNKGLRTESPFGAFSPPDSDSEASSTTSSTSTSGSSGGEYSCETGQHSAQPSLDTGQRFGPPLDTGQSRHQKKVTGEAETETLEMITDLYLSKGVKSLRPRTYELRPLETIPEDQILSSPSLRRESSIPTLSDNSSLEVRYEDLFGSDGFEWDDFCGDSMTEDMTEDVRTNSEIISDTTHESVSEHTMENKSTISSTRQAVNQILSRSGLLNRTSAMNSAVSESSEKQPGSEFLLFSSSNRHPSISSQVGLSSAPHTDRNTRSGGDTGAASMYSLAEDYSFDSDSLSEVLDTTSVASLDREESDDAWTNADTSDRTLGSHLSPLTSPSTLLPSQQDSFSSSIFHNISISDNPHATDPLQPVQQGERRTHLSHAQENTSSDTASASMVDWDLLGLEAAPVTPTAPGPETTNESASPSESAQATLIDLL